MDLDGSLTSNLRAAIASAERLRGHSVHKDTLEFWAELVAYARTRKKLSEANRIKAEAMATELASLLAEHQERG